MRRPGKDQCDADGYRPVTLTCCMGKACEGAQLYALDMCEDPHWEQRAYKRGESGESESPRRLPYRG